MHLQEIVRTAPVVVLRLVNDPFLILQIVAGTCEIYAMHSAKEKNANKNGSFLKIFDITFLLLA
ncbi:TPA: hypothetical protein ACS72I_003831 [Providencia alcalifaciens]